MFRRHKSHVALNIILDVLALNITDIYQIIMAIRMLLFSAFFPSTESYLYYILYQKLLRHTLDYDPNTWSYLVILDHERYLSNDYSNYIEEQCLINFALIDNVLYFFCDAFFQSTLVIQFDESSPKFNFIK